MNRLLAMLPCLVLTACATQTYESARNDASYHRSFIAAMPANVAVAAIKKSADKCYAHNEADEERMGVEQGRTGKKKDGVDMISILSYESAKPQLMTGIEITPIDAKTANVNVVWTDSSWRGIDDVVEKWSQGFTTCGNSAAQLRYSGRIH